ncbi:hypothetical protein E2562_008855 [Oryza meyeriana var. granulata]|uniref:Pentatricopeptide repeat-containing protein n=1 Tax=Oryza meyeriana var. granulata TaxID=110450 RepID=A0A6G1CYV0_9ORYZ|nr:hypothetical protein E2562_008855 [Oryza meyeriana var. granulata]
MLAPSAGGASRHVRELLRRCGSVHRLNQLHAHLVVNGSSVVDAVASQILASYCAIPAGLCYARHLFDRIPDPERFMYNNLIRAYCNSHCPREALRLHRGMIRRGILPNEFTLPFVLKACTTTQAWDHVLVTHGVVVKLGFVRQGHWGILSGSFMRWWTEMWFRGTSMIN